ncbi:hypothetical protein [Micromonospora fulviviridis]|uniref:DUF1772 domain-containing protein n=1 Tax=Micromonospora fulviviridis TaxID=47860 RepID=A0ABV2VM35_9ACTN
MQESMPSFAVRYVWRGLAASMVAVAWGTLGYGLLFSRHDQQAWDDLEAGGRLAANLTVYLPYLALALPVAVVVVLGLLPAPHLLSPLLAATVGIALFVWWVTAQGYLFDAQPRLAACLVGSLTADAGAVGALTAAWVRAGRQPGTASPRDAGQVASN